MDIKEIYSKYQQKINLKNLGAEIGGGVEKIKTKYNKIMLSRRFWYWFFASVLGLTVLGVVVIVFVFVWFSKDLPTPNKVVRREGFASRIYDRNGELLYDLYKDAKRTPVVWEDLPDSIKNATIAVEDKEFYKHQGFDPLAPFRIVKNIFYFHKLTGGSTLTQQLVKNVLLTSDVSVTRKIKEFILSVQIEAKYKKSEILLMYLNEAPYGGAAWGVGTASQQYFGKPVKDLNLTESVILAGLPQRPNVFSPFSKTPKAYIDRTQHVIDRMVEDKYITADQGKQTMEEAKNYKFYQNSTTILAPHFVFWIKDLLAQKYGDEIVEGGGLKITTTLDLKLQTKVQQIVSEEVDKSASLGISNGAAVVVDPTNGQVLAMVGSRGFYSDKTDGQFNVVTQGLRQPGSSIKPVVYLTSIRKGMTASTMIMDTPVIFPSTSSGQKDYVPQNYNGKFNGPMALRYAFANSINTTAVKTLANVGLENVLQQASQMGFTTLEPTLENMKRLGLSLALGGGEIKMIDMARAYSAFANGGLKPDVVGVLKVEDSTGRVLEEYKPVPGQAVMTPQEAFIISNILSDNKARELTFGAVNGLIVPNYQVAVKTGTTNDKKDNWAVGWTPNALVDAWVGNNDNKPMTKVASGVSGATPIWRRIMLEVVATRPKQDFPIPEKIINIDVDSVSGYNAHDGFASRKEYFIDGTQPSVDDPIHMKLKVCKGSFGLAPPEDVASNNYDSKEYFKFVEADPISKDGKNRWQEGIDSWINTQADKDKYNVPSIFCRSGGLLDIGIDSPAHQSTVGNSVEVRLKTTSLKKVAEVKLWVDGVENKTWLDKPYETTLSLTDGKHILKAQATDKDGNKASRESYIGVNVPWDYTPSPTGLPTTIPTNTPVPASPTPTIIVVPTL
ncbi:transglycosylase domain-containing protein [Candidatus Shapirobacteria bacterium]|nr:transglycosylase domain-containing protein [Candidatus Shapirobacteria bacterium]